MDAFTDRCIVISWHNAMEPPLPCATRPAATAGANASTNGSPREHNSQGTMADEAHVDKSYGISAELPNHLPGDSHYDQSIAAEVERMQCTLTSKDGESNPQVAARHLSMPKHSFLDER